MGRMHTYIIFFVIITLIMAFLGFGIASQRVLDKLGLPTTEGQLDVISSTNGSNIDLTTSVDNDGGNASGWTFFVAILAILGVSSLVGIAIGIRGGGFQPENFIVLPILFTTFALFIDIIAGMVAFRATLDPAFSGILLVFYFALGVGFVITSAEWFRGNV